MANSTPEKKKRLREGYPRSRSPELLINLLEKFQDLLRSRIRLREGGDTRLEENGRLGQVG